MVEINWQNYKERIDFEKNIQKHRKKQSERSIWQKFLWILNIFGLQILQIIGINYYDDIRIK